MPKELVEDAGHSALLQLLRVLQRFKESIKNCKSTLSSNFLTVTVTTMGVREAGCTKDSPMFLNLEY